MSFSERIKQLAREFNRKKTTAARMDVRRPSSRPRIGRAMTKAEVETERLNKQTDSDMQRLYKEAQKKKKSS